jgi:serine/threonine protein phosphatase 1
MATYVISDIHGQLEKLKEMLELINFKYDGSDEFHILGDMIDWGKQSLETLLYCKELAEKYSFVILYRGNHEQMMFDNLYNKNYEDIIDNIVSGNWHANNGGHETFSAFLKCNKSKQLDIIEFLGSLVYFNDNLEVNGQKFYLSHAAPYTDKPDSVPQMYKRLQNHKDGFHFVIWHRFGELEESFVDEKYKSHILIHGHTPTKVMNEEGLYTIYRTRDRICIDTGAKMLYKPEDYPSSRLSCLRLDDLAEFYVI